MSLFKPVDEKEVTRAIVRGYLRQLEDYAESDVVIVGGGPAGLMAGRELAKQGFKTLIVERMNYLGGGFWIGGYLMNKATFREPSQEILDELAVPYEQASDGLYVADAPHACAKLVGAAYDAGVRVNNMSIVEDIILHEGRIAGVVVNWTPVTKLPREITCLDPIGLQCRLVVDATGHDASVVKCLERRGLLKVPGMGAMWVERSEDAVVEHTGEVFPGLIVAGMSVAETYGLPRMGPTFGAMLLSGKRAAEIAAEILAGAKVGV